VPPSILVLWDIDHTLIATRGVGSQVYAEAFRAVTGRDLDAMPPLAGGTEPVIFREALGLHGIANDSDLFSRFADAQARGYAEHADQLRQQGHALPGAADALRELAHQGDIVQSVLTGNTRPSAEIKLRAFDLDKYLNMEVGAYGTDAEARAGLVTIARQRAEAAYRTRFDQSSIVLIGDTPNDVEAALSSGTRIIAVATGSSSTADLTVAGAATVLQDLSHTRELVNAIHSETLRT
jgi:phosphoglycolate phosphatase-like HAD superfamily hydrolase